MGAREETAYQAEKSLSADYAAREITLRVTGRADGLLLAADGARIVEEIKLGTVENPLVPAHRAQAAMYGHMLCQKEGLTGVRLRILYVDENGAPVRLYEEEADSARLKGEFEALCAAYCAWAERLLVRRRARDASLFGLAFPYGAYRAGQRTFAANVYVAIRERKRLFAQAPTGIGKTMAALYPAALALGEGKCARVLMLTARTTGRKSAMDALAILRAHGARLLAVEIAAKDKVCPMEKRDCRPEVCPYAKEFYDRLPDALAEALTGGDWGRGQLDALAQKHTLCPFELALSLAQEADVVVCDYNYVFDPFVAIDALMQGGTALLIDEAHQLAPRVQDNASAAVSVPQLRALRRGAGQALGRKHPLYGALTAAMRALESAAGTEEFASGRLERPPEALDAAMARLLEAADGALLSGAGTEAAEAFTLAACWRYAAGRFDARYAVLTEGTEKTARIELFLLCAAQDILEKTKRARGTVFFSATLAPFEAAKRMLGSLEGDACLALPSPFDKHQLDARILPIDLRYAAREANAPRVAEAIRAQLAAHPGNAMVFFPSYAYLSRVDALLAAEGVPGAAILREARGLTEEEKNALLGAFDKRDGRTVLSDAILSQADMHALYGGVVPEIASRKHVEAIAGLTDQALREAGLTRRDIDAVAVTYAPGLIGAVLVGVSFAKSAAYALGVPLIPVHHVRGHIAANYLAFPELEPPFLALAMSGGNTLIVDVKGYTDMEVLGATRDDAAGECFDKAARVLGLPYPGGKPMDQLAARSPGGKYVLPRAHVEGAPLDMSFSGLKTAVVNLAHNAQQKGEPLDAAALAHDFNQAVSDELVPRAMEAARLRGRRCIVAAGGVAANTIIRGDLERACEKAGYRLYLPPLRLCGDNGAMIGAQGYYEYLAGRRAGLDLNAYATMELDDIFY